MKIGIKSGCFSLFHAGHIWCIQKCAELVDYLIVLTNDDSYIKRKKGSCPIPLDDRLYILKHIVGVNEVGYFSEETEDRWIKDFYYGRFKDYEFGNNPELVIFHSDELKNTPKENLPGFDFADEIIFIDKINRKESVSKIYEEIRKIK